MAAGIAQWGARLETTDLPIRGRTRNPGSRPNSRDKLVQRSDSSAGRKRERAFGRVLREIREERGLFPGTARIRERLSLDVHQLSGARGEKARPEACIGSIGEIFDAEPPYTPRGCVAQAWSVAEVLRCWAKTSGV